VAKLPGHEPDKGPDPNLPSEVQKRAIADKAAADIAAVDAPKPKKKAAKKKK